MKWHEIAGLTPLMVLIVAIGVYPRPLFDRIGPPVREIASRFYVPPLEDPLLTMTPDDACLRGSCRHRRGQVFSSRTLEKEAARSHVAMETAR